MINSIVVKKYLSIGAVAILFILIYKISDDIGKQKAVSLICFLIQRFFPYSRSKIQLIEISYGHGQCFFNNTFQELPSEVCTRKMIQL